MLSRQVVPGKGDGVSTCTLVPPVPHNCDILLRICRVGPVPNYTLEVCCPEEVGRHEIRCLEQDRRGEGTFVMREVKYPGRWILR